MIEVHPKFSEAPHLRSSIPHPKTDFSKNQIASRRIIPWPESTKRFFSKSKFFMPKSWGQGTPGVSETKLRKCDTSIVERVIFPIFYRIKNTVCSDATTSATVRMWPSNESDTRLRMYVCHPSPTRNGLGNGEGVESCVESLKRSVRMHTKKR